MRCAGGAAIATGLLYVVLLGWHAKKHHSPGSGRCTGPYDPWQVVALAVALGLLVAFTAWKGHGWYVVAVCAVTVTVLFSADAVTVNDPCSDDDGLWIVGAGFLFAGAVSGLALADAFGRAIRVRTAKPHRWGPDRIRTELSQAGALPGSHAPPRQRRVVGVGSGRGRGYGAPSRERGGRLVASGRGLSRLA
jgi:hypothetical protein